jgi:16S rRNA (cytosine967-C5)-methyltransferase
MRIESRFCSSSKISVRKEALNTLLTWEKGKENLDYFTSQKFEFLPKELRGIYFEMVRGTVRHLGFLDYKLKSLVESDYFSLPSVIRNLLRLGAYQLEFMNFPKPSIVNSMVELSKTVGHSGTSALVNGVLRKLASKPEIFLPENQTEALSVLYSHPLWLVERWVKRFGAEQTEALMKWNNSIASLEVRVNSLRITTENFLKICDSKGIKALSGPFEGIVFLEDAGAVEKLPGYSEGFFWVQSFSAQLPVFLLHPRPGEKVLDMCAAPGGKSCQIAEFMQDEGEVLALDKVPDRMRKIEENRRRVGFRSIHPVLADAREAGEHFPEAFDSILLDVPCSSTGSLRRKVDVKWKKSISDLERHSILQLELLNSAALSLKPGGNMVYCTCSLEMEENESIIEQFLTVHPNFILKEPDSCLPNFLNELNTGTRGIGFTILPQKVHADGFFMALLGKN